MKRRKHGRYNAESHDGGKEIAPLSGYFLFRARTVTPHIAAYVALIIH